MRGRNGGQDGLTLIELVIVLAIIAIIGAVLVPNFLLTTDKARLKGDIQSARVMQSAITLYNAEQAEVLKGDMGSMLKSLHESGYIKEVGSDGTQTSGAKWIYGAPAHGGDESVLVDISGCDNPKVKGDIFAGLSDDEKKWVVGGSGD